MLFKKKEESPLCRSKEQYGTAFLLAFLGACALFIPYIVQGQGYFLYYGDFNVQQVPFYKLAHEAVRSGKIYWDFGTDLGVNFIGSYSFYLLGSPFFWLTIPFPTDFVPHLMGPLLILKFACASLTAYAYLTRFVKNKDYAVLGGLLYAFSGYSVYNIFFNHFHEAIIYFPLLLLGMELVMRERKYGLFIGMVALTAICSYYFFFGMVIFTVIYFIIRVASGDWDLFMRSRHLNRDFGRLGLLAVSAVLGLLISAFMLLPAVLAITSNTRIDSYLTGWNGLVYSRSQIYAYILQCFFFPPDLPARPVFFPDADVKWSSVAGWMPVFSMTGVIAYMAAHRKSWQKKLMVVCGVMAFIPILNSAYSAFNYSYYARWFYMPILIMALMTVQGLEDKAVNWVKGWKWTAGITVAIILAVGLFPQGQYADGTFSGFGLYSDTYQDRFLVTCAIAVVGLLLLLFLLMVKKRWKKEFSRVAIAVVLLVSVVYSSYCVGLGQKSSYSAEDFIIPRLLENNRTIDLKNAFGVEENTYDIDDLRVDVYEGMDNVGMFFGIGSVHAFHSIVPGSVMEFYDYVGVQRTVATRAEVENYALRSLLSVKYVLDYAGDSNHFKEDDGNTKMPGWSVYTGNSVVENPDPKAFKQNDYYIYENDYFIPYGFTYDYYMTEDYLEDVEETSRANLMLKAILLDDEQVRKYGHLLGNFADEPGEYVDQTTYSAYYTNCRDRAQTACTDFVTDAKGFSAKTAPMAKDNLVFFSVPYEEGWTATVDGQPVDIEKVNVGFMAVPVAGDGQEHSIRFDYKTPGLSTGVVVTVVALVATVGFLMLTGYLRRREEEAKAAALAARREKEEKEKQAQQEAVVDQPQEESEQLPSPPEETPAQEPSPAEENKEE